MSTPVLLAVILHMQASLQGIRTAAGYRTDVRPSCVVIDPVDLVTAAETPFVVLGHRIEPQGRTFGRSRPNGIQDIWRVVLEARVDAPGSDTARKLTAAANFVADVEQALVDDFGHGAGWGITRGGLVLDTRVAQETQYLSPGNQHAVYLEIPVEVRIQRAYGQA